MNYKSTCWQMNEIYFLKKYFFKVVTSLFKETSSSFFPRSGFYDLIYNVIYRVLCTILSIEYIIYENNCTKYNCVM